MRNKTSGLPYKDKQKYDRDYDESKIRLNLNEDNLNSELLKILVSKAKENNYIFNREEPEGKRRLDISVSSYPYAVGNKPIIIS